MSQKIDFYAPAKMPRGHVVYGAAAANHRAKLVGNWNEVVETMFKAGVAQGMQMAYQAMMQKVQRK